MNSVGSVGVPPAELVLDSDGRRYLPVESFHGGRRQFYLLDERTGQPLKNRTYTLTQSLSEGGRITATPTDGGVGLAALQQAGYFNVPSPDGTAPQSVSRENSASANDDTEGERKSGLWATLAGAFRKVFRSEKTASLPATPVQPYAGGDSLGTFTTTVSADSRFHIAPLGNVRVDTSVTVTSEEAPVGLPRRQWPVVRHVSSEPVLPRDGLDRHPPERSDSLRSWQTESTLVGSSVSLPEVPPGGSPGPLGQPGSSRNPRLPQRRKSDGVAELSQPSPSPQRRTEQSREGVVARRFGREAVKIIDIPKSKGRTASKSPER